MNWKVPPLWKDGECFIIGGGSSLFQQLGVPETLITELRNDAIDVSGTLLSYFEVLKDKHIIGVNMAYKLGDFLDFTFFGDEGFWNTHKVSLMKHSSIKVTCNGRISMIKILARDKKRLGLTSDPTKVSWNGNSGGAAINMAAHTKVKRIILLGFDMTLDANQNQHWHKYYPGKPTSGVQKVFNKHLQGFPHIAKDAKAMGIEILNANPNSGIPDFKKVSLKEVL